MEGRGGGNKMCKCKNVKRVMTSPMILPPLLFILPPLPSHYSPDVASYSYNYYSCLSLQDFFSEEETLKLHEGNANYYTHDM